MRSKFGDNEPQDVSYHGNAFLRLMGYIKPYWKTVALCCVLVGLLTVFDIARPLGVTLYGMWQAGHFLSREVSSYERSSYAVDVNTLDRLFTRVFSNWEATIYAVHPSSETEDMGNGASAALRGGA